MEHNGQAPHNGPVVVTGATGGVGSIAINMLAGRGYEVVAVSGKPEADDYLRELGAARILRRQEIDPGTRPMEKALWAGAVDNVGGDLLAWLTRTVDQWGNIASVGLAGGPELKTTVMPFILRGVNLLGINSVLTPRATRLAVWDRIAGDLRPAKLDRICTKVVPFQELPAQFDDLPAGPRHRPHRGEDRMNDLLPHRTLTHLERLEAESIHIMREVVAECDKPVMLYSIGKDSAVMLHLALKAFYPAKLPFPLLHVDTTWKFREMFAFRERMAKEHGFDLLVYTNPEGLAQGINPFTHGSAIHTDVMKTAGAQAGARPVRLRRGLRRRAPRRGEEPRQGAHLLVPLGAAPLGPEEPAPRALAHLQRAQAQGRVDPRVPAVELDRARHLAVHLPARHPDRAALLRRRAPGGRARRHADHGGRRAHAAATRARSRMLRKVRFRTLGCYPLTGAIESEADTLPEIIQEMLLTTSSERQGRVIDHDQSASMEKKKQEGYF